jgi:hypothetical protein
VVLTCDSLASGGWTSTPKGGFVKFAQIRETHTAKAGHVSQYELWCGQAPNTVESLITAMQEDVIIPSSISTDDLEAAQMVADQCRSLVVYELDMRDEKARASNMRRDDKEGVAPQVTRFDLRLDEQVSYDGKKVTIVELTGQDGVSQTATVDLGDGKTKRVQYRDLRPLAVGRPCREVTNLDITAGDFVMWKDAGDNTWVGGKVEALAEKSRSVLMHRMQSSSSGLAWLYLWKDDRHIYRQKKQPNGAYAMTENVDVAKIRVSEMLKPTKRLTDALRRRMEDLEII